MDSSPLIKLIGSFLRDNMCKVGIGAIIGHLIFTWFCWRYSEYTMGGRFSRRKERKKWYSYYHRLGTEILEKYNNGYSLYFGLWSLWFFGPNKLNAQTFGVYTIKFPKRIFVSGSWLASFVFKRDDPLTEKLFVETIEHEVAHLQEEIRDGRNCCWKRSYKKNVNDRQFIDWTTELHCDYLAFWNTLNKYNIDPKDTQTRHEWIDTIINVKIRISEELSKKGKRKSFVEEPKHKDNAPGEENSVSQKADLYTSHPSWEQRRGWLHIGVFGDTLVNEVAKATNCKNDTLISLLSRYYTEVPIILKLA